MKQELGWYFPDGETHLIEWMQKAKQMRGGRLQYQLSKYQEAMRWVRSRHLAVDIGAHVGHWSWNMAEDFLQVVAFEPVPQYAECWRKNMEGTARGKAVLHEVALGLGAGTVSLACGTPGSHGDTHIAADGDIAQDVPLRTLDSFNLQGVSLIKIDVEGYEFPVVKGGTKTILESKPVIIVEQKGHDAKYFGGESDQAVKYLRELGMVPMCPPMSVDWVLGWI